jgi:hypothetical protein
MERKLLGIDVIRIDGGTQCRAEINQAKINEYAELIESGVSFPAVRVFFDGVSYWLADGFHRYHAHRQAAQGSISADVEKGIARDALLYAIGANAEHGLPRTNADKRKAVQTMLDDFEWQDWSNAEIARHCRVSVTLVASMRGDAAPEERKYKTATGKVMTKKTTSAKPKKEEEPEPEVEDDGVDEKQAAIDELIAENEKLTERVALAAMDGTEAEKNLAKETIESLREELRITKIELVAVKQSRDTFQAENAQMKSQIKMLQKKLEKLQAT